MLYGATFREQVAELTRLSNTLLSVPDLAWVVAEDSEECTQEVADLLRRYSGRGGGGYAHLAAPMPSLYRGRFYLPRGVAGRNAGAQFVVDRTAATDDDDDGDGGGDGVIFFGDDDNVYHLDLFEEIRRTRRVGMLPVGLLPKQVLLILLANVQSLNGPTEENFYLPPNYLERCFTHRSPRTSTGWVHQLVGG